MSAQPLVTPGEASSPLWQKLRKHLEKQLETLRAKNEGHLDAEKTANLRGRIAEVKSFLGLDKPSPEVEQPRAD